MWWAQVDNERRRYVFLCATFRTASRSLPVDIDKLITELDTDGPRAH